MSSLARQDGSVLQSLRARHGTVLSRHLCPLMVSSLSHVRSILCTLTCDADSVATAQFIVSCPDSNPPLPVTRLPKLEIQPGSPQPGDKINFKFKHEEVRKDNSPLFVAFFNGIEIKYTDLSNDDHAVVPDNLQGTIYAALVKNKADFILDQELLTGLVMFEVEFPSFVDNLGGLPA